MNENLEQLQKADNSPESVNLLDAEFMRRIERLNLITRRIFHGSMKGERRSVNRGSSVEFADYRNYSVGDDFRRVDWNVYARLEKLFLKLFMEEEDLNVYILIDTSKSMDFGNPAKLLFAKQVAAALSYIALSNMDRAGIASLNSGKVSILSPKRSKQSSHMIFNYLNSLNASGDTDLADSIRSFSLQTSIPGLAIVISDFFDESYKQGISSLLSRKFDVVILHILDQNEVAPSFTGDLMMIDSETGSKREITITQSLLRRYRDRFNKFCADIEEFSMRYGCNYLRITNDMLFDELILKYLIQRGLLA